MKHLGRAMLKIARIMEELEPDLQAELTRQIVAAYGRPLTEKERATRYRDRHGGVTDVSNGGVTPTRHDRVTDSRHGGVTDGENSTLCSSPNASQNASETTATKEETARQLKKDHRALADRLIEFLNEKAGRSFRKSDASREPILARLAEGATEANCRGVIARKVREWRTDPKMAKYLRPETLFNRTKFESYLGERPPEADDAMSPVR